MNAHWGALEEDQILAGVIELIPKRKTNLPGL
jgi:hypothetical protein